MTARLPVKSSGDDTDERIRREIVHHRRLADDSRDSSWGWSSPAGQRRADRRAGLFVTHGRFRRADRILELGCGSGEFTRRVVGSAPRLIALDLSAELLERARRAASGAAAFVRADAQHLPFAPQTFDGVYGCSVLHHLDVETTLREIRRVLRVGGRLVFSEPNLLNPQVLLMFKCRWLRPWLGMSPDEMAFTRRFIENALRRQGFRDIRVQPFDFLHPAIPARLITVIAPMAKAAERIPGVCAVAGSLLIEAAVN